ncbi:flagellar basal body-associated FliL family protein [Comamonas terrigena]|uniref:flagellar basal body-associated FliL family protein n=1 Tax=Comamonas terrigena TaxID=32013 RepID=UPI00244AD0AC|nr:flagellar basal body protein [Comamonas terrigena]MDH1703645.1 flagellar basal body protein [Comamonas terrigena]
MLLALVVILGVGVAAGGWWWGQRAPVAVAAQTSPQLDVRQASYVTLDKIVVMLKTDQSLRTANTYMSLDLVLRTDKLHEKAAKAELPMLKGVAVRTLSQVAMEQAKAMSIDEWTELLTADLVAAYASHPDLRPFDKVMVSRLIIE